MAAVHAAVGVWHSGSGRGRRVKCAAHPTTASAPCCAGPAAAGPGSARLTPQAGEQAGPTSANAGGGGRGGAAA